MNNIPWRLIGLLAGLIALVAIPALLVRSCDRLFPNLQHRGVGPGGDAA